MVDFVVESDHVVDWLVVTIVRSMEVGPEDVNGRRADSLGALMWPFIKSYMKNIVVLMRRRSRLGSLIISDLLL